MNISVVDLPIKGSFLFLQLICKTGVANFFHIIYFGVLMCYAAWICILSFVCLFMLLHDLA